MHQKRAEYENSVLLGNDMNAISQVALPRGIPQIDKETGQVALDANGEPITVSAFPPTYDPRFRFDRHDIHISVLQKLVFSREFGALKKEQQHLVLGHLDMHEQALAESMALMRAQQMDEQTTGEVTDIGGQGPMESDQPEEPGPAEFTPEPFEA